MIISNKKLNISQRSKRAGSNVPISLYVEYLAILDSTVYSKYLNMFYSFNFNVVMQYLKIQYSHIISAVSIQKINQLQLKIYYKLRQM